MDVCWHAFSARRHRHHALTGSGSTFNESALSVFMVFTQVLSPACACSQHHSASSQKESNMVKRILPLLIGLSIAGVAAAQDQPATAQSSAVSTQTTQTTTTVTTWTAQPPAGALTEDAIKTSIGNAGYKEVKGLEFKDGVWRSEARGGNKK